MTKIISVHEYTLKPDVDEHQFERAVTKARNSGLFDLPGLSICHFVKGIRGQRRQRYAFIWIYESKKAWERLWGPVAQPTSKENYPEKWRIWENEILAPFLDRDPNQISFTAYEEV